MKKILLFLVCALSVSRINSQTLYSGSFGNLTLQTYTTASSSVQYTTVPTGYSVINNGLKNNVGTVTNPNKPFNVPSLKTEGWAVVYNALENDTFLVSTSWLDTTLVNADRWVITPPIANISANTVLTWRAKSPDTTYLENYYVYGTNKTGTLVASDFTVGDQIFTTPAENSSWTRRSVSLASFAGQTLRFAFRDYSIDKFQLWIDDIEVITLPTTLDAELTTINAQKYVLTGSSQTISTNITNLGATPVGGVTLNYQIGNSTVQSQVISFVTPIAYQQSASALFALPYSITTAGNYKLKVWLSAANLSSDQNHFNDTLFTYVTVQTSAPRKKILVEQFVNAFDGECADAQQKILAHQNDSVIVVNIHDLDSLKDPNSIGVISAFKKNSATAMFDRSYFSYSENIASGRPYYDSLISIQLKKITPATVSIINKTYNSATRLLSFTLKADFIGDVKGDFRLNAYLTENNVHGPYNQDYVNGYNQLSNYYNVPWSNYFQTGTYAPAYSAYVLNPGQFNHQDMLAYSFNGSFGNSGTIPTTGGTQNQSYQQTFTLTIPTASNNVSRFNEDNLYIVGFLAEYNTSIYNRNILNVSKEKMTSNAETLGLKENSATAFLSVYPNPSNGNLFLNSYKNTNTYEIKVFDLMGRCVKIENQFEVGNRTALDLSALNNGIYFLHISAGGANFVEKIVIQKN